MNLSGLILLSLGLGLAAWAFFMWTVKSGQYEDPEGAKYRMLEEDEGVPPARKPEERQLAEQKKPAAQPPGEGGRGGGEPGKRGEREGA